MTKIGSLFSGLGALDIGVLAALGDGEIVWHAETDPAASAILARHWPDVPNLGDVARVDWRAVEPIDVLTGGFPCQDVSAAGRRAGMRPGSRSALWSHMAHAIRELRPALVVIENVRGLLSAPAHSDVQPCPLCLGDRSDRALRAFGAVLGDLAVLGYDTRSCGIRASDVGAPHERFRVFILAADAAHDGHERQRLARGRRSRSAHDDRAAADAARQRRGEGWTESERHARRRSDAAERGPASTADAGRQGPSNRLHGGHEGTGTRRLAAVERRRASTVEWGEYEPAVRRWEAVVGRAAPSPTEPNRNGQQRLSAAFVEWMMGLPRGYVTDVDISRARQITALGNGVVPQQAEAAVRLLLDAERAEAIA